MRKFAVTALISAVLTVGCSTGESTDGRPPSPPAASPTPTAVDLLKAGTAFIEQVTFRTDLAISGAATVTSHTDNASKRAAATLSAPNGKVEIRAVGDDLYMMAGAVLPGMPKSWMIVDPAKIPDAFVLSFAQRSLDPGGSARLINAITSAQSTGADVSGTIDIGKIGVGNGISFPGTLPGEVQRQFQATLDGQGRLTSFTIQNGDGTGDSVRYSEFGAPVTVSTPQGAVPAPETLYPLLGTQ